MKTHKWTLLVIIPLLIFACNTPVEEADTLQLEVSKEKNIKQQEPVYFRLINSQNSNISWQITPATDAVLKQNGDLASALFTKAGNYTVTSVSDGKQLSKTLQVTDSVYIPPISDPRIEPIKKTDKLRVYHVINDSSASGKPDILVVLQFITTEKYPTANNYLMTTVNENQEIEIRGVYIPELKFQTEETSVASGGCVLFPDPGARSNPISITINGIKYTGNYWVNEKKLHINWTHSGIVEFVDAVVINQN